MKKNIAWKVLIYNGLMLITLLSIAYIVSNYLLTKKYLNNIDKQLENQSLMTNSYLLYNNNLNITQSELKNLDKLGIGIQIDTNSGNKKSGYKTESIDGAKYRILYTNFQNYQIRISKSISEFYLFQSYFNSIYIIVSSIILGMGLIISYTIGLGLKIPLDNIINKLNKTKSNKFYITYEEINNIQNQINQLTTNIQTQVNKKKELLEDTSHELRSPVMAILSTIELLENHKFEPKIQKKFEIIKQSALRLEILLNNFLLITQNDSNLAKEKVNINNEIEFSLKRFNSAIIEKSLIVKFKNTDYINIIANKIHIQMLIDNLIKNAIDYNKQKGKIEISIMGTQMIIKDSGIGISNENIENIWKRFYKNSSNTKGVGLGLNIVKKICNLYNININVNSELGIGTEFILNFNQTHE